MKRSRFKHVTKSLFMSLILMCLSVNVAMAFGFIGTNLDAFCTTEGRTPATPFSGDCTVCHDNGPGGGDGLGKTAWGKGNFGSTPNDADFFCQLPPPPNTVPTADAGGPYMADTGVAINFVGTGADADGDTLSYAWDFGDGNTANTVSAMHAYATAGTYDVSFTVSDGTDSTTDTTTATITDPPPPANIPPTADAGGPYAADTGVAINFVGIGTDADGDTLSYAWDFGDGNIANTASAMHTYATAGTYDVSFTVSDGTDSTTDTTTATITDIAPPPPPADNIAPELGLIGDRMGTVGMTLDIELSATDADLDDQLTFSAMGLPADLILVDNGTSTGSGTATGLISGIPSAPGTYDITVKVTDDGTPPMMDEEMFTLTVKDEMTPPTMEVKIESEAEWKEKRKRLRVKGKVELKEEHHDYQDHNEMTCSSLMDQIVTITNESGKKLATRTLDCDGKFKVRKKVRKRNVSCFITVSVAGTSIDVEVEHSPADNCKKEKDHHHHEEEQHHEEEKKH